MASFSLLTTKRSFLIVYTYITISYELLLFSRPELSLRHPDYYFLTFGEICNVLVLHVSAIRMKTLDKFLVIVVFLFLNAAILISQPPPFLQPLPIFTISSGIITSGEVHEEVVQTKAKMLAATSFFGPLQDDTTENKYTNRLRGLQAGNEADEHQEQASKIPPNDRKIDTRPRVLLVIAIPSVRAHRRQAIRDTWLKWGDDRVVLRFFTEIPDAANEQEIGALARESGAYGDIVQLEIPRGMNFGVKLLEAMRWTFKHFQFDFFLRLDDDYFVCLRRLVDDLDGFGKSNRSPKPFYSGSLACVLEGSYVDEAYILLSSEIVSRIISSSGLRCTQTGSLTAAAWMAVGGPANREGDVQWVRDKRLDYMGKWWKDKEVDQSLICQHYIGVHRTYPHKMYEVWAMSPSGGTHKTNVSDAGVSFRYEDDGHCPYVARGVSEPRLRHDLVQPCHSYTTPSSRIWCGNAGC